MIKKKIYILISIFYVISLAGFSLHQSPLAKLKNTHIEKISTHLLKKIEDGFFRGPVLVRMKKEADLTAVNLLSSKKEKGRWVYDTLRMTALQSQKDLRAWLDSKNIQYKSFYIVNMIAIENATPELIGEIAMRPDVGRLSANPKITSQFPQSQVSLFSEMETGIGSNLIKVQANKVWDEFKIRGEGIVIAGQDSGVDWEHPALKNQYRGFQNGQANHNFNWHDAIHKRITDSPSPNECGYDLTSPCDDGEHGTHTMGTVVGSDGGENQIGMAPHAKWIACRNMDQGTGMPSTYIECFEFFLAPYAYGSNPMMDGKPELAPHVVNNSWGCPQSEGCTGDEILPALKAMKAAGIMVVVSAGNSGSKCGTVEDPPAYHTSYTLSVGAIDHTTGIIAPFSSRGPSTLDHGLSPHVTAPGVNVKSSIPGGKYAQFGWSGTSMAGPHTAGEVALLWSAKKSLIGKIDETAAIIQKTSTPKTTNENCGGIAGSTIPNNTYGYGIIDAYKAVSQSLLRK